MSINQEGTRAPLNLKKFEDVTLIDESIDKIIALLISDRFYGFRYLVTPNIDHFQRLSKESDTDFISAYRDASYVVCDSRIVQKLSWLKGPRLANVVPGSDLTLALLSNKIVRESKVGIIGPSSAEVEKVSGKLGLTRVICHTPAMGFIRDSNAVDACIEFVIRERPDYLFIAVGSPQQELLAKKFHDVINKNYDKRILGFCVGASIDFISGKTQRAPFLLQRLHLEWLHRLLVNPRRLLPRYSSNLRWVVRFLTNRS